MVTDALSLGPAKFTAPELRELVIDITRTIGVVTRPFGIAFPPASDVEADAIAAPAARMLGKWPRVQKVIRRVADPIVLSGAIIALFASRQMGPQRAPSRPVGVPQPTAAAATPSTERRSQPRVDFGSAPPPVADVYGPLRESILNGIAHADVR